MPESKAEPLKTEIESLEKTQGEAFEPPPKEWLVHRIGNIQEVLERKTEKSALLLRDLTGKIVLTPAVPDVGRPYYRAKSKLKSFAVLNGAKGSNSLQWWPDFYRRGRLNGCNCLRFIFASNQLPTKLPPRKFALKKFCFFRGISETSLPMMPRLGASSNGPEKNLRLGGKTNQPLTRVASVG